MRDLKNEQEVETDKGTLAKKVLVKKGGPGKAPKQSIPVKKCEKAVKTKVSSRCKPEAPLDKKNIVSKTT